MTNAGVPMRFGPYTQQTQNTQLLDTYVTCFFDELLP